MTPRELEVLDFVRERITVSGVPPRIADIAAHVGIAKTKAHGLVSKLVVDGKLKRRPRTKQGLELVGLPDVRLASTDALAAELRRRGVEVLERRARPMGRGVQTCAADTCGEAVRVGHVFCRRHWFMLPDELRGGILRTSRAGETARLQGLLATARDIADGLTPDMRAKRA